MIRRMIIAIAAWALRRGIPPAELVRALDRTFPHRTVDWRLDILGAAIDRNSYLYETDARLRAE